jgi:hypothetical protein
MVSIRCSSFAATLQTGPPPRHTLCRGAQCVWCAAAPNRSSKRFGRNCGTDPLTNFLQPRPDARTILVRSRWEKPTDSHLKSHFVRTSSSPPTSPRYPIRFRSAFGELSVSTRYYSGRMPVTVRRWLGSIPVTSAPSSGDMPVAWGQSPLIVCSPASNYRTKTETRPIAIDYTTAACV